MKKKSFSCPTIFLLMVLLSLCLMTAYGCAGTAPKPEVLSAEKETVPPKISSAPLEGDLIGMSVAPDKAAPTEVAKEALVKKDHYRTVWYGTNRKPAAQGPGYTVEMGTKVHYGKLTVFVPKSHQLGSVKSPHWYYRALGMDRLKVEWEESVRFSKADFVKDIRKELDRMKSDEKIILVYIHGYNVDFEKAAIRTAQLSEDLSINGIAAFYSWPSKGDVTEYFADENKVEASEYYLYEFLAFIADKRKEMGASNVHIIAHSMGNRALLRALNRLEAEKKDKRLFGKIFLAAPDVDSDVFERLATVYPKIASGTTLYVSPRDIAMKEEAKYIHKNFRVGYPPPITIMKGIETISFEGKTDLIHFGHLYYADSIVVLCHLYEKIHGELPTGDECRSMNKIKKTTSKGEYFVIK